MHAGTRCHARRLPDGRRLHLQDGPIDLIIEATGQPRAVESAYEGARRRFATVLDELCAELPALRSPDRAVDGVIARAMAQAVKVVSPIEFITPMAAVAGAVADEILGIMLSAAGGDLACAYVNNGGDIALHLKPDEVFTVGLVDRPDGAALYGQLHIKAADGIGGIATSGVPGRSFSLGIADAVTVLAATGALADAAATVVANAVDIPGDPRIYRVSAHSLQPDSDLGERLVTRRVDTLDADSIHIALDRGCKVASRLLADGLIAGAALHLQGQTRICDAGGSMKAVTAIARGEATRHA